MITFKEFLKESKLTIQDIIKECQPFLKESNYNFIYRGVRYPQDDNRLFVESPIGELTVYRETTRLDRRPKASNQKQHDAVDDMMYEKFGIRGRSQSIFVSGTQNTAKIYGTVYIVLPRGEFKFLWSPEVYDLYGEIGYRSDNLVTAEEFDNMKYQDTNLTAAIKSGCEIMIACKDYYIIQATDENINMLKDLI